MTHCHFLIFEYILISIGPEKKRFFSVTHAFIFTCRYILGEKRQKLIQFNLNHVLLFLKIYLNGQNLINLYQ